MCKTWYFTTSPVEPVSKSDVGVFKLTHVHKSQCLALNDVIRRTVILNVYLSVLDFGHLHGVHRLLEVVVQLDVQKLCKKAHTTISLNNQ